MSENFVDRVDGAFRSTVAARYSHHPVQKGVRRVCGLEPRRGAKVVRGRIDGFAADDCGNDFWGPVTQAERSHRDERAVVSLERDAKVHLQDTVRPEQLPVGASARQDPSTKTRALERT